MCGNPLVWGDVAEMVDACFRRLSDNDVLKPFIDAYPVTVRTAARREFCRAWANQREVTVPGFQFIQEDAPVKTGRRLRSG